MLSFRTKNEDESPFAVENDKHLIIVGVFLPKT
jgi:hypothetical protein